ncbi:MAG: hypothetical protein E7361_03715 [Clostridiales bacterium]|nr:hypothetical protein [Clostridiales bacterium]
MNRGIEGDPMYFMPTSSIIRVIPMPYAVFLVVYILFMIVYISSFYFINDRRAVKEYFNSKRNTKNTK